MGEFTWQQRALIFFAAQSFYVFAWFMRAMTRQGIVVCVATVGFDGVKTEDGWTRFDVSFALRSEDALKNIVTITTN